VLPFYRYQKKVVKPFKIGYPIEPKTIGEHIKKIRMDKGLLQKQVAEILHVSEDTVTYWENGRSQPQVKHYPTIIEFLGYYPFAHETSSMAGKVKQLRHCLGYSYYAFAKFLNIDPTTVKRLEQNKPMLRKQFELTVNELWVQLPKYLTTRGCSIIR
jgi:DNA-binding transcriptional regulator YiaG